ncbi:MAG TPA: type II CAAX endopeptidase family protein [Candidatus Sulfopaludibacter sp.]|nr:type II CAAX endopeptidase family protein [Candidatus Sulfopaludibacter sp.]
MSGELDGRTPPPEQEPPPPESPLPPPPEREPFWSYSDLALLLGLSFPALLLSFGLVKVVMAILRIHDSAGAGEAVAAQIVFYVLLFFSLRMMFLAQYGRPFWRSLGWKPSHLPVLTIVMLGIATAVGVALASTLLRTPEAPNPMTDMMRDSKSLIVMAVFGVTMAPVCEELAFRGFLQPLLVRGLGAAPGIVLAGAAFGLLHFREYGNSWRHAVVIALAGSAFGCMRHLTGSTRASALMHAAYNGFLFAVLLSQRKDLPHLW